MNRLKKAACLLPFLALAASPALACFTVYNSAAQVVYSGIETPIDMSYQIHERLPLVFPGGHMVFGNSLDCPAIDARKTPPQLTNVAVSAQAGITPAPRTAPMSRAARQRAEDALTK